LVQAIRDAESLAQDLYKPVSYANLIFAEDMGNPANGAFLQKQMERMSEISVKTMFFELEIQQAPAEVVDRAMAWEGMADYRHYISVLRAYSPHRLSEVEEVLLEETANTGTRAWVRLFEEVTSNHEFAYQDPNTCEQATLTQEEVLDLLRDPDRAVRQAAADSLTNGLKQMERVIVFTYNNLLQDKKVSDRLRKHPFPEHSRHLANELDKETVDLVIRLCRANYGLVERFYRVKREILGLDELTHIDRYAPLFDTVETVSFDEAKEIVLRAFGRFSPKLSDAAAEFFDRKWIDAEPRPGKSPGAFCSGVTPDRHPVVLMSYLGKMDDVTTLAHELGHGVHASLARRQTLFNFDTTLPIAELASTFGEMLVFEDIAAKASVADKLALYAEKIEGIFATVFRQAAMFQFEQACHTARREQGELTPEQFGDLWQEKLQEMFGDSIKLGDQHRSWWSYVGHFFFAPFYVYAYSFGELLVLSLYQRSKSGGAAFAEKYVELLASGGSKSPQDLLRGVDVDIHSPVFWQGGFDAIDQLVGTFEGLWAEYRAAGPSAH
ncbi:MAG: M3 family oligoendopeptidase, partial [Fimbriimonadaceae bacterium]